MKLLDEVTKIVWLVAGYVWLTFAAYLLYTIIKQN